MPPARDVSLYRVVHGKLLPSLIARGLLCRRRVIEEDIAFQSISNEDIERDRASTEVGCGPGGSLHDYVPFHFGPRSPMMCRISYRNLPNYQDGQRPLVYLVTTIGTVIDAGCRFVFSDGHPTMALTDFYDDLNVMDRVDHALMRERMWKDTQEDNDRERRRQAEFLVFDRVPWEVIREIGAIDRTIAERVKQILDDECAPEPRPSVVVRAGWYYQERS
jgi:hypothetical protein